MLRRLETLTVVVLSLILIALWLEAAADLLVYSPSPSVEHQLFARVFRPPWVEDFVVFCAPEDASRLLREHGYPSHPRCPDKRVRLVKRVAALRPGELFVLGSHPRSVDSRRFGWIPISGAFTVVPLDHPSQGEEP